MEDPNCAALFVATCWRSKSTKEHRSRSCCRCGVRTQNSTKMLILPVVDSPVLGLSPVQVSSLRNLTRMRLHVAVSVAEDTERKEESEHNQEGSVGIGMGGG